MLDWKKLKKHDYATIFLIVLRAEKLLGLQGRINRIDLCMDIGALHIVKPLDLQKLLHSEEFDFLHFVGAIRGKVNWRTGRIKDNPVVKFCAVLTEVI